MKPFKLLFKYNLLLLILLLIIFISISTIVVSLSSFIASAKNHYSFAGDARDIYYPGLTYENFKSHELQQYIETLITNKLRFRHYFIGINNTIYYSLFKRTFAEDGKIIVGKHNNLFESKYITSYCNLETNSNFTHEKLIEWADKIKILQKSFESHGKTFIYVITPSKAEYMPQAIPHRFQCHQMGLNQHIVEFTKLLDQRKVHYINSPRLMNEAKNKYHISMFPPGGTHWNWLGATLGANAVIQAINAQQNWDLPRIAFNYRLEPVDGHDSDDDLSSMLKLLKPKTPLVPKLDFITTLPQKAITASIIGASFNENMIQVFIRNKTFSKIFFYFYYNSEKIFTDNYQNPISHSIDTESLQHIVNADVIILEENSAFTISDYSQLFFANMKKEIMV